MKNRKYLKKYLIQILIVVIVFLISFIFISKLEYNEYKRNFNYKINGIFLLLQEKYPDITKDDLIKILNSDNSKTNILKEYGYDIEIDSLLIQNDKLNVRYNIYKVVIIGLCLVTLIYLFVTSHLESDKEIDKIIRLLEKINHKNYELNIDELSEDKLSILREEIYKTTIMLKENADNSLKDKINIKNSLQDISHQLKTPLTSINIMLDNISDDPNMKVEVREEFIRHIKREMASITFLVQAILKLSRFESNTITFYPKEVSVQKIIDAVISNVSNLSDLKNICIVVDNRCKNKIKCDFKWQVEALTNILKNAIEYSHDDNKVILECNDNNLYTEFRIKDFGKGMSAEDTINIFKRFYKGENTDINKDSIGIGLSLSKAIIEKDNGQIVVESKKEKGTTFIIKYFKAKL
ncbi:signal transduction histidine kinase [Clostridium sp. CAG:710]|nr:signal transduction histidine kinase [Clostridium sp. CAG:710]